MNRSRFIKLLLLALLVTSYASLPCAAETADEFSAMVGRRIRDWQPTKDERLLDQVGWASDLMEARRLAKKHERPLFVFTYSGSTTRANAIALQRC